jgi:hypothetical protein
MSASDRTTKRRISLRRRGRPHTRLTTPDTATEKVGECADWSSGGNPGTKFSGPRGPARATSRTLDPAWHQVRNAVPCCRSISSTSRTISGDRSPLRVLMMIGETAPGSSSVRWTTSRRRRSTEAGPGTHPPHRPPGRARSPQLAHVARRPGLGLRQAYLVIVSPRPAARRRCAAQEQSIVSGVRRRVRGREAVRGERIAG